MRNVKKYKIHWYRLIPFVIAEIENPEWDRLKPLIEKGELNSLAGIYNTMSGNWYVLEGLDYFWFRKKWLTNIDKDILFSDSMWLRFNGKPDEEKYEMLIDQAKENIDFIWSKLGL